MPLGYILVVQCQSLNPHSLTVSLHDVTNAMFGETAPRSDLASDLTKTLALPDDRAPKALNEREVETLLGDSECQLHLL
jgi:hypothetical protein